MSFFKKFSLVLSLVFLALITASFIFIADPLTPQPAGAQSVDQSRNIIGHAWSENIGWVSFNCANHHQVCANDRSLLCGLDSDCPGAGDVCLSECSSSDYGVTLDETTGGLSGYAWSPAVGWVSFNRRTCNGDDDDEDKGKFCTTNNECNSNSCPLNGPGAAGAPTQDPYNLPASLKYNAHYDSATGKVTGWAKIIGLGDDGWLKLSDDILPDTWPDGVSMDAVTFTFTGWAWNGNDNGAGIGWLSFHCADRPPPDNDCLQSQYGVILNKTPKVNNLSIIYAAYLLFTH